MEMSIDEAVLELRWLKKVNQEILETDAKELDVDSAWIKHWENVNKSLDTTIDTMRKYQKIQEIVNSNPDYIHPTDMDTYKVNSIRKVVGNGNDD